MKYLLFGTGDYYERYKKWFPQEDILALLDNSPVKQNTYIDGIQVLSPETGIQLPFDVVVILSFYVEEMRKQLEWLGVFKDNIYHFFDLHKLLYRKEIRKSVKYYGQAKKVLRSTDISEKKVLLLSQDLTLGGPSIALFYGAKVLKNCGYQVVYVSMLDGPLREPLLTSGISVIVDHNLQISTMKEIEWICDFSLLICNTIHFHVFLSERNVCIPVIWWLHESSFFYGGVNKELLQRLDLGRLRLFSVGPVPKTAICDLIPEVHVEELIYGVEDTARRKKRLEKSEKIHFVTIGYIEKRKGQDVLIKAIKLLSETVRKKADFCLVGQDISAMAKELKLEIEKIPEIRMTGVVDRQRIMDILNNADVLVCPSREDPMPTVAAEAMMNSVPCIVSRITGISEYIQDGEDGFLFENENIEQLAEKLRWCIEHRLSLPEMGRRSRKIYEKYFSMKVFEKRFLDIVKETYL